MSIIIICALVGVAALAVGFAVAHRRLRRAHQAELAATVHAMGIAYDERLTDAYRRLQSDGTGRGSGFTVAPPKRLETR